MQALTRAVACSPALHHAQAVTQWDRGEYAHASNHQNDIAVISRSLPLLRSGHHTRAAAAPLAVSSVDAGVASASASGVVTSPELPEVYSFKATAAGAAVLSASVTAAWKSGINRANLDLQLTVMDAAGITLALADEPGADPTHGLGVSGVTVQLPAAGTYFVAVNGVGAGDPAAGGYSAYGSLGNFVLNIRFPGDASSLVAAPQPSPSPSPSPSPAPSPPPEQPSPSPAPKPASTPPSTASPRCVQRACCAAAVMFAAPACFGAAL